MRIALSLVALLLLMPGHAWANPIVEMVFYNSDLVFGRVSPMHSGRDMFDGISVNSYHPAGDYDGFYEALAGPLVRQTVWFNASGAATASEYLYEGGTFQIDLDARDQGATISGRFVAPIVTLLVSTTEPLTQTQIPSGHAYASYVLGPGVFDAPIAQALGVGTHTLGGTVFADMIAPEDDPPLNWYGVSWGDYTSPERGAWDGFTEVALTVPEPSLLMLSAFGISAFGLRRAAFRKRA